MLIILIGHRELINLACGSLDFDGVEPELGMQLLSLYWNRQLHSGLVVYRPAFMRDMACGGTYFSKLLLNAMYYSVSKHSPCTTIRQNADDRATAGWSFRRRFTSLLRDEYDKSRITTIQALIIMASSLFTRCDERSASWLYAGNAFNMIIDLGLHVESSATKSIGAEELEIRRRVFWSAYCKPFLSSNRTQLTVFSAKVIDKLQCLYQGRHSCLRISDTNVSLAFADDYEEFEKFDPNSFSTNWQYGAAPSHTMSIMRKLCELSVIMERIQSSVYAVCHTDKTVEGFCLELAPLRLQLETWRKCLPPHLDFIATKGSDLCPRPHNLSML